MRKIVLALSLIAVTFAGTTVYFAHELALERERSRAAVDIRVVQTSPAPAPVTQTPPGAVAESKPAIASQPPAAETDEARMERVQADNSRRFLRMLQDPDLRAQMLAEYKMSMRNSLPRLTQFLGLSEEESGKLFDLLALQQVENQERHARCNIDPKCKLPDTAGWGNDPRAQEIVDLLGADRQRKFDQYNNSMMERYSVGLLRARLPDENSLTDDKAEMLIVVLAEERGRLTDEADQRGTVFSARDSPTPEARLESAQVNNQRLRQRAAEVLTEKQLRVFEQMQDEMLISLRAQQRTQEATSAAAIAR